MKKQKSNRVEGGSYISPTECKNKNYGVEALKSDIGRSLSFMNPMKVMGEEVMFAKQSIAPTDQYTRVLGCQSGKVKFTNFGIKQIGIWGGVGSQPHTKPSN